LDEFVSNYAHWVSDQQSTISSLVAHEAKAAKRITDRMEQTLKRMRSGVKLIANDATATLAFSIANRAMFDQMRQVDAISGEVKSDDKYAWRPFQLAFLLTVMESSIRDEDKFRDIVDLIWFPTGGGKTEAYLALIAFLIVWRRLTHSSSGGGTVVLMRYTLRLLTTQQYLRAARLICALDIIRQKTPELGAEPITIGMWVGAATSPNTFKAARDQVDKIAAGKQEAAQSLVLDACPWCGQRFVGIRHYIAKPNVFKFCCTNDKCQFGKTEQGIIPCNVRLMGSGLTFHIVPREQSEM